MTEARPRPHQRLLGRLLLLVLLPVLAVVLVILAINASRTWNRLGDSLKQELRDATKLAVAMVEADNRKTVAIAETMAIAQVSGLFAQRERTLDMCREVLLANPDLQGAYVAYEPNGDVIDAVGLEGSVPREAMSPEGRFIPYYRRDAAAPGGMRLEPLVGMEDPTSLWYYGVKAEFARTKKARAMVTRPYDYEGVFLIEQTFPIVIDGRFKGVAGVDRTLEQVQRNLVAIRDVTGVDLLLETRGLFVAATVDADRAPGAPALQATAVKDSPFSKLFPGRAASEGLQMFEADDPQLNDTCFYATATVPTGGWTLVARKPKTELFAVLTSMLTANLITTGIGIAAVVGVILAFGISIRGRIGTALRAAEQIAAGDLTQPIEAPTSRDETGDLLRGLGTMSDNLNRLVGQVQQASIQINSTANELAATSRQQQEAFGGFGASTSEIAAAVRQISATGEELVRTMDGVDEGASQTASLAESGRSGLSAMDQSMRRLDDATQSIGQRLATISEKASGITSIVTTITKVADQTNLLSVNAAIEAEKAGEYGAGFLVVAREIRRLADQAAGATMDIERMVGQMQSAVSSGVMEMDRFAEAVRSGVHEVERISTQFSQIIEQVGHGTESFRVVKEGMRSQAEGAQQINDAMTTLTAGARQTSQASTEFAQAAKDLQSAIAGLKSAISMFRLRH